MITTQTDGEGNIISENRVFADGYFTYTHYNRPEETVYNVLTWEGYYNLSDPTRPVQCQRPKNNVHRKYDENGTLLYMHLDTPEYSTNDPSSSDYEDGYTGNTPRVVEYYEYDPDGTTVRTYDGNGTDRKLVSESWTDDQGKHTMVYGDNSQTRHDFDDGGKLTSSTEEYVLTESGIALITTHYDAQGNLIPESTGTESP